VVQEDRGRSNQTVLAGCFGRVSISFRDRIHSDWQTHWGGVLCDRDINVTENDISTFQSSEGLQADGAGCARSERRLCQ
jgi:hypothetical protein